MKKLIYIVVLFTTISFSQTNIVDKNEISYFDVPEGTYLKDVTNTFTPFLGTWKYQNGNNILIFKLEKVTQWHNVEDNKWEDYIKGNYSYSTDGGVTYLVNTIIANNGINDPDLNPMYSCGPNDALVNVFTFKDIILNKLSNEIAFKFVLGSTNQMTFKIVGQKIGIFPGDPPRPDGFSIPTEGIVIKQ